MKTTTKKLRKGRLLKLAKFLETKVPQDHFYMGAWGMMATLSLKRHECKSHACALGWATVLFSKQGYQMGSCIGPEYCGSAGLLSAVAFFGLPLGVAVDLFGADLNRDRSAKEVAQRIRKTVAELDV